LAGLRLAFRVTTLLLLALLFGAAALGGVVNAVAGGGAFFTFPTLMFAGVGAVQANATSTMSLWPGTVATAAAYRRDVKQERRTILTLVAASVAGGVVGALLLLKTPESTFRRLVPWLLLAATLLFAAGPFLTKRLSASSSSSSVERGLDLRLVAPVQFALSVYGGYFGGGVGILVLTALSLFGMRNLSEMNGLRAALGASMNGFALLAFVAAGVIVWNVGLVMVAGSVLGGYAGARYVRRVDARLLRAAIIVVRLALFLYFVAKGG
jgi:uncharacterized membrane protein YfcA